MEVSLLTMEVDVSTEVVIDRRVAEVVAYAGDPTNAPEWYTKIRSVRRETDPPFPGEARTAPLPFDASLTPRRT